MRTFFLFIASSFFAFAQSHPGWWTFVAPESKSLVGIEWANLRDSPFGEVVRSELATGGNLALPDLPCLMNARDFLLSSPPLLAAANSACSPAVLRTDAVAKRMKSVTYRGFDFWVAPEKSALSVAQFSDRVVLIGLRKSLEAAIDRSLAETHSYSPLLIQGARLARTRDLWVVATEFPDALASVFVPLDIAGGQNVRNFEGGIALRSGLDLGAILDAGSDAAATEVAANFLKSIPALPAIARGLQVATTGSSVTLALRVAKDELQAGLRQSESASQDGAQRDAVQSNASPTLPVSLPATPIATFAIRPAQPKPAGVKPEDGPHEPEKAEPSKLEPQVIRIVGLDDGPREIVLPPKRPQ